MDHLWSSASSLPIPLWHRLVRSQHNLPKSHYPHPHHHHHHPHHILGQVMYGIYPGIPMTYSNIWVRPTNGIHRKIVLFNETIRFQNIKTLDSEYLLFRETHIMVLVFTTYPPYNQNQSNMTSWKIPHLLRWCTPISPRGTTRTCLAPCHVPRASCARHRRRSAWANRSSCRCVATPWLSMGGGPNNRVTWDGMGWHGMAWFSHGFPWIFMDVSMFFFGDRT